MSVQFQSLFTIQLLHDYYNRHDNKCPDFDIVPTEDGALKMKNMQALHKNFNNKLLTVINATKVINENPPPGFHLAPFIGFSDECTLRFYLVLKNAHFSNFTSIALQPAAKQRFYFSNLSNNKAGNDLSLSAPIAPFISSKLYSPGHLVNGADGNVYEAIRTGDGTAASKDTGNIGYWQQAAANHPYASNSDMVILAGNNYHYKLQTPASHIIVQIFSLNKADNNLPFDQLIETVEKTFAQNQETVAVDFSKKPHGKYKVVVNNEEDTWIYVDPAAMQQNIFGIIEIFHFEKIPPDFQLLTQGRHIKTPEPVFTIRFKNRSVIWKYISQNGAIGVSDAAATPLSFIPGSALVVQSQKAIALTETPIATLTATKTATGKQIKKLHNPEVQNLVFEQDGSTGFFASNMYIKIDA